MKNIILYICVVILIMGMSSACCNNCHQCDCCCHCYSNLISDKTFYRAQIDLANDIINNIDGTGPYSRLPSYRDMMRVERLQWKANMREYIGYCESKIKDIDVHITIYNAGCACITGGSDDIRWNN
jgi:hypothetical protein